jgi:menaquinone-specific isochorismate synthase
VRDDVWLEAVARALDEMASGRYEKVVLARDLQLWSRAPFDTTRVLDRLAQRFPSCTTFLVDHLIGASPERLLRRSGDRVSSRVLAGTAGRGTDAAEDALLGSALLASAKDLHEHDLAVRSAVGALSSLCPVLHMPAGPSLVRLDNVQHLGSDLEGTLDPSLDVTTDTHVLELIARLHPTAAVGGAPRSAALEAIGRLEGMSRGRYAGPVGWFTPGGDGEFAIALRCAEIRGERARLFAGAGIVAGSLPEAELTETWLKLRAMTGVLDG